MFTFTLPPNKINPANSNQTTNNNSLIIIGANGSGKSKLGAWIEQYDLENVHRVSAQRSLNFNEYIPLKGYEQAQNAVLYGYENTNTHPFYKDKRQRWSHGNKTTTTLLDDYENVLAALIAKENIQLNAFHKECRAKEVLQQPHNNTSDTVVDRLKKIWSNIFSQRDIDIDDAKIIAKHNKSDGTVTSYKGLEMSDGERVGLYLIAQCLCVPPNKTIIIDEPEIHLHRSIMNCLWTELEKERPDCLFIYITHDTQFAANHKQAKKIWVKSFDGVNWDWEEIQESTLPEQLLLDIVGNRKKVLFVEGDANSYDTKLYREIYKDYYVVPCGGCSSVIARTKAMKQTNLLNEELECFGLIDRDFRGEQEINALQSDGIYTISVAEVENLLLAEELLEVVNGILAKPDKTSIDNIKKYIIDGRFAKEINRQILEATVAELKYQLSIIDIPKNDEIAAKHEFDDLQAKVNFGAIKAEQETRFNGILATKNYKHILSTFNRKDLVHTIGHLFGLKNDEYCDLVIRHLQKDKANEIISAITPYLPREIL